jgi:hypothetical protein
MILRSVRRIAELAEKFGVIDIFRATRTTGERRLPERTVGNHDYAEEPAPWPLRLDELHLVHNRP